VSVKRRRCEQLLHYWCAALSACGVECSNAHPCEGLSDHAHFRNFGMAFLTLFRVATGDNWNGIMKVSSHRSDNVT